MVTKLKDSNFSEALASEKPVLVLFSAHWSGHSELMEKVVEGIAERDDSIDIYTAPAVDCTRTIAKFGIRTVPTLALFDQSTLVGIRIGPQLSENVTKFIQSSLKKES
tara:strand:- start:82519 stop:82842 length:324 start_codon:yes stop_codon:yes gene_type:complete